MNGQGDDNLRINTKKRKEITKRLCFVVSACNPKKYTTFPVLWVLGIGSTIGDESHLVEHEIASPTEDVHPRESLVSSTHC